MVCAFLTKNIEIKDKRRRTIELQKDRQFNEDFETLENQGDDLLICRESHLCTYTGFQEHFEKLYNDNNKLLFHNPQIYEWYGDEIESEATKETLSQQIIALRAFDRIKKEHKKNGKFVDPKIFLKRAEKFDSFCASDNDMDVSDFYEQKESMAWNDAQSVDLSTSSRM